jgi:hypothetical protein
MLLPKCPPTAVSKADPDPSVTSGYAIGGSLIRMFLIYRYIHRGSQLTWTLLMKRFGTGPHSLYVRLPKRRICIVAGQTPRVNAKRRMHPNADESHWLRQLFCD